MHFIRVIISRVDREPLAPSVQALNSHVRGDVPSQIRDTVYGFKSRSSRYQMATTSMGDCLEPVKSSRYTTDTKVKLTQLSIPPG